MATNTNFPRWRLFWTNDDSPDQAAQMAVTATTAACSVNSSVNNYIGSTSDESAQTVIERLHVADTASSSSSSDFVLAYHVPVPSESGLSAGRTAMHAGPETAEFHGSIWPAPHCDHAERSDTTASSSARELVVNFDIEDNQQQQQHHQRSLDGRFPAWCVGATCGSNAYTTTRASLLNFSNTDNREASPAYQGADADSVASAATPDEVVVVTEATRKESSESAAAVPAVVTADCDQEDETCKQWCSPMRCLGLVIYYLLFWAISMAFTWLLLEVSLMVTSKGRFPYYMSSHSFCLSSPQVGFAEMNPEPGKETEFSGLPAVLTKLESSLKATAAAAAAANSGGDGSRDCDLAAATAATADLMRPCNMTKFVDKALEKARTLLTDRPAALVQIRRHLGYLPVSGSAVEIKCTATIGGKSVPLRYHSWVDGAIADSTTSGTVSADYFPLLTSQHNAPSVLVSVDTAVKADWLNQRLSLRCRPSDGGKERPERQAILIVKG